MCEQFMDVNDMIRDEDLIVHKFNPQGNGIDNRFNNSQSVNSIQRMVANMVPTIISKRPSARELNLLKRKAKINSKDQTKGYSEDGDTEVLTTPKESGPESLHSDKVFGYICIAITLSIFWEVVGAWIRWGRGGNVEESGSIGFDLLFHVSFFPFLSLISILLVLLYN